MWFRADIGYTEKVPVEHHVGRHCFVEADHVGIAEKRINDYFTTHRFKDLKVNHITKIDYIPTSGILD